MISLLYGAPNSSRAAEVDGLYRTHAPGALLVVPTRQYARRRAETLLRGGDGPGSWGRPVWTFLDLAVAIIQGEGLPARQLDAFERRLLVEQCVRRVQGEEEVLPGLVTHLLRVITQLKQEAIEPEEFLARVQQEPDDESYDALVAETYAAFQEALKAAEAYDVPGLYWQARICCLQGKPKALARVDALLFDGFDDFTPSEFRLIEALAPHMQQLVIGLHYDNDPDRQDVYAISLRTLDRLREAFQVTPVGFDTPPPATQAEFAAAKIFWRNQTPPPEGLAPNLQLLPCADRSAEAETIARKIKQLVVHAGAKPHQIAVVYQNLNEAAPTLREVFREYGITMHCTAHPALAQSCLGTFLRRLVEAQAGWEREPVVEVLTSPLFRPQSEFPRELVPAYAREAGIVGGAQQWHEQAKVLEQYLKHRATEPLTATSAKAITRAFKALHKAVARLPESATLPEHVAAFEHLLTELGVGEGPAESEQDAHRALRLLLSRLARAEGDQEHGLEDFFALLLQGLKETAYTQPQDRNGVLCIDAASARNLSFEHVFYAALNEGRTPAPPAGSALYTHADLERLERVGVRLPDRHQHAHQQRLLFAHVLFTPRQSLTLTWRLQEGGREAARSHFVQDAEELFAEGTLRVTQPTAASFLGEVTEAASRRDVRNHGYYMSEGLEAAFPDLFAPLEAPVRIETARNGKSVFEQHDGVIQDPALLELLQRDFGEDHLFSTNQLEQYITCPFSYFVARVLHIQEPAEPDTGLDPMLRGQIMHRVLQRLHRQYKGVAAADIPVQEAEALLADLVPAGFQEQRDETSAPEGVMRLEQHRMLLRLQRYLALERARKESWAPAHFEVSFGNVRDREPDPLSTTAPLELPVNGSRAKITGTIDRIDYDGDLVRIVDYKSGPLPGPGEIASGNKLQLSLYAMALEQVLLKNVKPAEACYIRVGRKKQCNILSLSRRKDNERRVPSVRAKVTESVLGIRGGNFPPTPRGECSGCGSALVCRYSEGRIETKLGAEAGRKSESEGES